MKKDSTAVPRALLERKQGNSSNELVFDPKTGELIVKGRNEIYTNPEATAVDQIADDGFFLN